jgi:dienelactone hydrolase
LRNNLPPRAQGKWTRASGPIVEPISAVLRIIAACLVLSGCAGSPLIRYSTDTPPLVLAPASQAGVQDRRGRFREIYCAVLHAREHELPDYRTCEDALTRVGNEPAGTGRPVDLGPSKRRLIAAWVAGIGYDCFESWLDPPGTVGQHVRQFGYDAVQLRVDGLSSSEHNARQIRDAIMAMPSDPGGPRLVLMGYSKGAPDILEAVVRYPEIRSHVAAVVSVAGVIGGSPLAIDAEQYQADMLRHFPGATCSPGDGGAVASLKPAIRQAWLARNPLPPELHYYSVVTFPNPGQISSILISSYNKLARVDARNDSQMIFYDEVMPGSVLVAYLNADHWAVGVPINRRHGVVASTLVTRNAYPREALLEALLRFVEEDLGRAPKER